jgi:hypothetical protein
MRRALVMALVLGALGAGCKRKPALVKTPIRQLAPVGGGAPVAPEVATADPQPTEFAAQPQSPTDAQAPATVPVPRKPAPPSVANPYTWSGGKERLPMYKQRAKFF